MLSEEEMKGKEGGEGASVAYEESLFQSLTQEVGGRREWGKNRFGGGITGEEKKRSVSRELQRREDMFEAGGKRRGSEGRDPGYFWGF